METGSRVRPVAARTLPAIPESWLPSEHNLYRPRHSTRQRTALVCAVVFFLSPLVASVAGVQVKSFENRAVRSFPSPTEGWGFFTGLSGWATDHLAFRQSAIRASYDISFGLFGDTPPAGRPSTRAPGAVSPPASGQNTAPADQYPSVIRGKDGWLYLGADITGKCFPEMDLRGVWDAVRRLRTAVESSGRRFEIVIAPDKSTAVPEFLPESFAGEECFRSRTTEFWSQLPHLQGAVDLRSALESASRRIGRPVYDPNDSHWTFEGGLVMTYALAERLSPAVTKSWKTAETKTQRWPADIPPLLGRSGERELQAYGLAPGGTADRTRYVASDFRTAIRFTQPGDSRAPGAVADRVGLIADSFSQFASPFLAAGFPDLVIVHHESIADFSRQEVGQLLADRDVVAVELAERNMVGGASPLLRRAVIDRIAQVLAEHPR